jgi:hypothetical protein
MKTSYRPAANASLRLVTTVIVYMTAVAACEHSNEIGFLLGGICKIAARALSSHNGNIDAGADSGN